MQFICVIFPYIGTFLFDDGFVTVTARSWNPEAAEKMLRQVSIFHFVTQDRLIPETVPVDEMEVAMGGGRGPDDVDTTGSGGTLSS